MEGGGATFLRSSSLAASAPCWAPPTPRGGLPLTATSISLTASTMASSPPTQTRRAAGTGAGGLRPSAPMTAATGAVEASRLSELREQEEEATLLLKDLDRTQMHDVPTPAAADTRGPIIQSEARFTRAASASAVPYSPPRSATGLCYPKRGGHLDVQTTAAGSNGLDLPPGFRYIVGSDGRGASAGVPADLAAAAAELSASQLCADAPEFTASAFHAGGGVRQPWTAAPRLGAAAPVGPLGHASAAAAAASAAAADDHASVGSSVTPSGSPLGLPLQSGAGRVNPPVPHAGVGGWVAADGSTRPWSTYPAPLPTPTGSLGRTAATTGVRASDRVAGRASVSPPVPAPGLFPEMYKIDPCPADADCVHVKKNCVGECFYWHPSFESGGDRRRSATGTYSPAWCRYLPHAVCRFGDSCHHAHNRYEVRFHPSRVHQTTCRDWIKRSCNRRYCSYVHEVEPKVANALSLLDDLDDREMVQAVLRMPENTASSLLQKLQRRAAGSKRNNGWVLEGMTRRPDDPVFGALAMRVGFVKADLRVRGHAKLSSLLKITTLRDMMNSVRKVAEEVRESGRGAAASTFGGMSAAGGGGGGGVGRGRTG